MEQITQLPWLSQFDPPPQAEGSLDPLGLYAIADALAVKLAPGVRERQRHPRYLTIALVGMAACGDELIELGETKNLPPWLAFEWLVVVSLVRAGNAETGIRGVPGRDKVLAALKQNESICRGNYLKSPEVFGFHGIYRTLGLHCGLHDEDGRPLEAGYRLLQAWQRDQGLSGFLDHKPPGEGLRRDSARAVRTGIEAAGIKSPAAGLRDAIARHLDPFQPGAAEREALWELLTQQHPLRGEYLTFLVSAKGRQAIAQNGAERALHQNLSPHASPDMRRLLQAILAYERVARLLTDAFNATRHQLTSSRAWLAPADLSRHDAVRKAAAEARAAWQTALPLLEAVEPGLRQRLQDRLAWLDAAGKPADFIRSLLDHHEGIQSAKPPNGKRSWFDRRQDGQAAIRPVYALEDFAPQAERYVHAYRATPLLTFAQDLGRLPEPEGDEQ